jgi:hypothetical protein
MPHKSSFNNTCARDPVGDLINGAGWSPEAMDIME